MNPMITWIETLALVLLAMFVLLAVVEVLKTYTQTLVPVRIKNLRRLQAARAPRDAYTPRLCCPRRARHWPD